MAVIDPLARSGGGAIVSKAFNPTVDTAGDAPSTGVNNKRSGASDATDAVVQTGGDNETGAFSGGDEFSDKQSGGGANPSSVSPGSVGVSGVANVIDPGDSMVIHVQNDTTNSINLSIDVDWIEIPMGALE